MSDVTWYVVTPATAGFWEIVGPLCADPKIRREIGAPISVKDSDVWVIGKEWGAFVACSSLRLARRGGLLVHEYVVEERRRCGYHRHMIQMREEIASKAGLEALHVTASPDAVGQYEALGYTRRGTRGKYTLMHKELSNEQNT